MEVAINELEAIGAAAATIAETISAADMTTSVDHLGRWRVHDVVAHLGGVHRWCARIVQDRSMDGPSFTKSRLRGDELRQWFDEGVDELLDVFQNCGRNEPCPNFNPGSTKNVAWWLRRQMHETTVHRWDIESALTIPTPIAPTIAADGIDEFLDVFVRTRGKQTLTAPLILTSDNPAQSWTLTAAKKPGRLDIAPGRSSGIRNEIAGPAEQLLLHCWGRLALPGTSLRVVGDKQVALSFSSS